MNKRVSLLLVPLVFLFISCSSDDDGVETANLRVNYYTLPCTGSFPTDCLQVQEGNEIGGSSWFNFFGTIEGFEFEPGFVYDLQIEKTRIENPPADGSSYSLRLVRLVSKSEVVCTFEDPVADLEWLSNEIRRREIQANDETKYCYISQAELDGEPVFLYFDCNPLINKVIPVFDCLGRALGHLGPESVDPANVSNYEIIWQPEDFACIVL
ncbi:DUF4377 domain-containing protein [Flagellimonas allohymeniacidonis]|uniref:DUF4377 domain-containing protein n=1 Tax=Flagellimonas allohymeniacidonis TaxID=2517819 RepID=A0A4Q8QCJ1_9FLAO|nr:DUF4377 domain-containing protein [Allomuricauda hymeniacidonis]TAI46818.1 DUF4377 domain-containing protein [Allomuricauda hymeniacidonis]